jgi:hypothetical protein
MYLKFVGSRKPGISIVFSFTTLVYISEYKAQSNCNVETLGLDNNSTHSTDLCIHLYKPKTVASENVIDIYLSITEVEPWSVRDLVSYITASILRFHFGKLTFLFRIGRGLTCPANLRLYFAQSVVYLKVIFSCYF